MQLTLYTAHPPADSTILHHVLQEEELVQSQRLHQCCDREQFLAARALLRLALSRSFDTPPLAWKFGRDQFGHRFVTAPTIPENAGFSVSHTHGLVACLIWQDGKHAGVDVERISYTQDLPFAANEVLSEIERAEMAPLPLRAWTSRFFELWTLKEAYAKAIGKGLLIDFASFSFHFHRDGLIVELPDGTADHWAFFHFRTMSHCLAVAAESEPSPLIYHHVCLVHGAMEIESTREWPASNRLPKPLSYSPPQ